MRKKGQSRSRATRESPSETVTHQVLLARSHKPLSHCSSESHAAPAIPQKKAPVSVSSTHCAPTGSLFEPWSWRLSSAPPAGLIRFSERHWLGSANEARETRQNASSKKDARGEKGARTREDVAKLVDLTAGVATVAAGDGLGERDSGERGEGSERKSGVHVG